jgi:hypothetical protein
MMYFEQDTFAEACRKADFKHEQQFGRPAEAPDIPIVADKGVPSAGALQRIYELHKAGRGIPVSVLHAAEWLYFQQAKDPARFGAWMLERTQPEREAIAAHLRAKEESSKAKEAAE